jgi:hypothetical protein
VTKIDKDTVLDGQTLQDIEAENCAVTLKNCTFNRFYALNCVVTVENCKGRNVGTNFVQLDKCKNSLVEWCEVINEAGKTAVEDNINLYESSDCIVRNNYVEGSTPSPNYSGSGIMVDKGCVRCLVQGNVVVNTQNAGIGVAGGTVGPGVNGNVGIYFSNRYTGDSYLANVGLSNGVCWLTKDGRNDWWVPDAWSWKRNFQLVTPNRDGEYALWLRRKRHGKAG